jgi:hypothetical protein
MPHWNLGSNATLEPGQQCHTGTRAEMPQLELGQQCHNWKNLGRNATHEIDVNRKTGKHMS